MDLVDLFERMMQRFEARKSVETVHEDHETVSTLVQAPGMTPTVIDYPRPEPDVVHRLETVDALVEYLDVYRGQNPRVFVNEKAIEADLAYREHRVWRVYTSLEWCDEYTALLSLFRGVEHRVLWETLVGTLHGVIDNSLLMKIGQIRLTASRSQKKAIELTGVEANERATAVTVTFADGSSQGQAEIPLDWTARCPLWEAWRPRAEEAEGHRLYDIPMRMTVAQGENGPWFKFHPRGLDDIYQQAKEDVVDYLRLRLIEEGNLEDGTVEVYEGALRG